MKIREILGLEKTGNQYDTAIRACYLLFYIIGLIVFIAVGLQYMTLTAWLLGLFGAAFGATVYGTIVKMIINMVRKDRTKSRADILIQLFYVVVGSALGLLNLIPFLLFPLIAWIASTGLLVFMIFGIVAASHDEMRELPLIGKLRMIR